MSEFGKTGRYNTSASNRAILDIRDSLRHMQVSQNSAQNSTQLGHGNENQNQGSFERQLGLSNNISALSEGVAGDRWSFPRVASSQNAFALENIRRDLKSIQSSTTDWRQNLPIDGDNLQRNEFLKSNSYTDLYQIHGDRGYEFNKSVDHQHKLDFLVSSGYDEVSLRSLCFNINNLN